jgi:hypothetical protein
MSLEDGAGLRFCKGAISVSLARGSGSCSGSAQRASPSPPPLRSHLSVKFKQWDGLEFRGSPLSRLPSNITWGPNWALRDAPAEDNTASPLPPFDLRLHWSFPILSTINTHSAFFPVVFSVFSFSYFRRLRFCYSSFIIFFTL